MPISTLTPVADLAWGQLHPADNQRFPAVGAELSAAIQGISQQAQLQIEALRAQVVPTIPAGAARDLADGWFNGMKLYVGNIGVSLSTLAAALDPTFDVIYMANGDCPINANPASFVELIGLPNFDRPPLPDYNLSLELNLTPFGVGVTIPFAIKWVHGWDLTHRLINTRIDQTAKPTDLIMKRATTHYLYQLRYTADIALGPYSLPPSKLWNAQQDASSVWCND